MPLNENSVNEILPFAPEGAEAAGDLVSLEEYRSLIARLRGFASGIARRAIFNRAHRQSAHMSAGLAQFIANRFPPGVKDDADLDKIEEGLYTAIFDMIMEELKDIEKYDLCEFYYFRHPTLKPGFQPAQGGLVANAAELYPEAWAYLQTIEGQKLCKPEAEWQALTTATWATLADGSKVGWNGIGGAPFYAMHLDTGALRLPDLRGMYAEAAGYDSLDVGGAHGDAVRDVIGDCSSATSFYGGTRPNDVFYEGDNYSNVGGSTSQTRPRTYMQLSRQVPTANKNQPRAWGALACVYLGAPK